MHKIFLTKPEVAFIHGSDKIVSEYGGFPSMENGRLMHIDIYNSNDADDYRRMRNVSLLFDISHWAEDSSRYTHIPESSYRYIQLDFRGVSRIFVGSPDVSCCGEFKFGNTTDPKKYHQDIDPSQPWVVERPFYSFYMQAGLDFVLEFNDSQCFVSATMLEQPPLRHIQMLAKSQVPFA